MQENRINILINIDKNYVKFASVMIKSLLINNVGNLYIYIMNEDLIQDDIDKIKNNLGEHKKRCLIFDIKVNKKITLLIDESNKKWPRAAFFRIFAPFLLPEDINKILYLDVDLVVDSSIEFFYKMKIDEVYAIVAEDYEVSKYNDFYSRLGIEIGNLYFNAGVILLNIMRIREHIKFGKVMEVISKIGSDVDYFDQDVLNVLFGANVKYINSNIYNFICAKKRVGNEKLKKLHQNAIIYHFGGTNYDRPWNYIYTGRYRKVYWKYAKNINEFKEYYYSFLVINTILRPFNIISHNISILYTKGRGKIEKAKKYYNSNNT